VPATCTCYYKTAIPLLKSKEPLYTGRVIYFCSDDFSVYVKKIKRTANKKLTQREKQFWQKSMEVQEKKVTEPDILVWGD